MSKEIALNKTGIFPVAGVKIPLDFIEEIIMGRNFLKLACKIPNILIFAAHFRNREAGKTYSPLAQLVRASDC